MPNAVFDPPSGIGLAKLTFDSFFDIILISTNWNLANSLTYFVLTGEVYKMDIKLLDNTEKMRDAFIHRFVMSWEEFQVKEKDWIDKMAESNYPITIDWYEKDYMWIE